MSKKVKVTCKHCSLEKYVFPTRAKNYCCCSLECSNAYRSKINFSVGDTINNWKIISDKKIRRYGRSYLKVKCTCGSEIEKLIPSAHFTSKKEKGCEKCSRFHTSKGFGLISGDFWCAIRNGARKRGLEFSITMEYCWDLFLKQKGKCALSGLEIHFEKNTVHNKKVDNRSERSCSLDRIDSSKGYVENNLQWVHKDVNMIKNKFEEGYFLTLCNLIVQNNKNKQ